jgi:MFS family permease
MCTAVLPLPLALWMLLTGSTALAFVVAFPLGIFTSLWLGPGASTVQDLVPPRMRAIASAAYLLVVTFVGLALGPYTVGRVSVAFGDLRLAMAVALAANVVALLMFLLAAARIEEDERNVARD